MPRKIKYPYEFDKKLREKAKHYSRGRLLSRIFTGMLLPVIGLFAVLYFNIHLFLLGIAKSAGAFEVQAFVLLLFGLIAAVEFAPSVYFSYVREHKYGLSNYTISGWIKDYLKGLLIEFVIAIIAISVVYKFLAVYSFWWIYAALFYAAFTFFFHYIFPVVVFPFFYKVKPYTDKLQRKRLLEMVHAAGAKEINNVAVALESEKSKKANAMFAGFGNTKQIVLFDTLLNSFTPAEVETVVAHELGHYVNKDMLRGTLLEVAVAFPAFYIVDWGLKTYSSSFGIANIASIAGLPLFVIIYTLAGFAFAPLEHWYSRRVETQADYFGLEIAKKPDAQISTDKRLADQNLSEIEPHPLVEWYFYDHPAIMKRIEMSQEWKLRNKK